MSKLSYVKSRLPTDQEIMSVNNITSIHEMTIEMLDAMQPKMRDVHPSSWKKDFEEQEVPWDKMHFMVNSDYRIYSAGFFTDGIAKDDNWKGQELFVLDIDDGLSLIEAKERFKGYRCLITTTKSHQTEKNSLTCDRFRVIMPTEKPITCSKEEYKEAMTLIHDIDFPFADKACKDPSRIYFGFSAAEHFYLDGQPFDFEKYLSRVKQKKQMQQAMKQHIQPKRTPTQRNAIESTQKGFYERTWCTSEMLQALKFDEKFVSGNRNNALLSWTKFFKEIGFSDVEVREVIFYINSVGDSVAEQEIETTIFRSQRIQ